MKRKWYWATAVDKGQSIIKGPYVTKEEADIRAFEELQGSYKILELPYKTQDEVIKALKLKKPEEDNFLPESAKDVPGWAKF